MRKLYCLMIVFCAAVLFSGISYADGKEVIKEFSDSRTIEPDKIYEKCVTLRPRQLLDYKFETSSPIYFNIHYHGEQGREYMIERNKISSYEATVTEFQYKKAYKGNSKKALLCMLWRNNTKEPVKVSLDCTTSQK